MLRRCQDVMMDDITLLAVVASTNIFKYACFAFDKSFSIIPC